MTPEQLREAAAVMMAAADGIRSGSRIGRWFVLFRVENLPSGEKRFQCICDCGTTKSVRANLLRSGRSRSCGCLAIEMRRAMLSKHGGTGSRPYRIWKGMKDRCLNPRSDSWEWYGARGVAICSEWRNDFLEFKTWALLNGYEDHLTIDRIDVDGNYEPSNCRWVTNADQQQNRRPRKSRRVHEQV
jgi:hypothetical protein